MYLLIFLKKFTEIIISITSVTKAAKAMVENLRKIPEQKSVKKL